MSVKLTQQVKIVNPLGLHTRPASQFVKLASKFSAEIWVEKDGEKANGKSIMSLMILSAGCDSVLTLTIEGSDAADAMQALVDLVASGFNEGTC